MSAGSPTEASAGDARLQARLHLVGFCILIFGLTAATVIYRRATAPAPGRVTGYETEGGQTYAVTTDDSKSYQYQMSVMGGPMNEVAAEMTGWFLSLWHGRRLANTLAVLSVGGSLALFVLAYLLAVPRSPDGGKG